MDDDPLPEAASINATANVDHHVKPMEDDSHSGNCSYDADASNDSIELNLSLDEQQPIEKQSHSNHTQSNHAPVSVNYTVFCFFSLPKKKKII